MIPEHYARDIVERCENLIESLLPAVQRNPNSQFGGPLGTTFLVAMSTPMILLPMERILKTAGRVADERSVNETLSRVVAETLSNTARFGDAPFARAGAWSYVAEQTPFNLAGGMPRELLDRLADDESSTAAMDATALQILSDLRNALAHGGIAYLNEQGQADGQAAMLAFVAKKDIRGTSFNVLRVRESDYRRFLTAWASWIREAGIDAILNGRAA